MDILLKDIRFAVRQLRKQPAFAVVAVLTLGLGIGAATAIFNVAEVALYRPLPFDHEDRLVRVYRVPEAGTPWISLRPRTYQAVERRGRFFDRIVAQRYTTFTRRTDDGPERMVGIAVTAGWAETLGVRPHIGRVFSPAEERLGAASGVTLLSYTAWQQRFGGDEDVLGRRIVLNGRPHTVVGVMQRRVRFPYSADLWVPMRADDEQVGPWSFNVQARLRPGVTLASAREELRSIARDAAAAGEASALEADGMTLTAYRLRDLFVGDEGRTTLALLGAVGFLLLIVCANLANLLLAKGLNREREFAVRASLGASRRRLVQQVLTEGLLLGGAGSGLGILLAYLGSGLAQPLLPSRLEYVEATVTMNGVVLGFAVGLALLSTLLFGLLPALRLSGVRPGTGLLRSRSASGDAAGRRLGASLVVAEIALGIVLLTGAGLVTQDLRRLASVDLGYDPAGLSTFSVSLNREPYTEPPLRTDFVARAAAELEALPGVTSAGVTSMFPSHGGNALAQIEIEGRDDPPGTQRMVNHRLVTPSYFDALDIPLLAGRGITERDRADTRPVVVISAATARRYWPDGDPIGERVRRSGEDGAEWMTVVGVVDDVREFWDVDETWYLPYAQHADASSASNATFAVRGATDTPVPTTRLREAMADVAPELPVLDLKTANDLYAESLVRQRQAAGFSGAFGAFGLLLAAMGLYGSISYAVNRRRREFGIRMAMGSDQGRILRNVIGEGVRLVLVGTVLGGLGAVAVARLLARALETVDGFVPTPFVVAVLVLGSVAVAAAALPARRAARVDPMTVLREE